MLTTIGKARLLSPGASSAGASVPGDSSRIAARHRNPDARLPRDRHRCPPRRQRERREQSDRHRRKNAHGVYLDISGSRVDIADSAIVTRGREAQASR
ncbi:hypothetical protein [Burkholderia ubonensis]|uniref:hypothetical protein n=1 Tax=Burkholderia ubonensis TaxID=101571 RepID=UPI00030769E3|nr:hypothetical protein [Burkholderia ubonensis]